MINQNAQKGVPAAKKKGSAAAVAVAAAEDDDDDDDDEVISETMTCISYGECYVHIWQCFNCC